jgi:Domain of unknown function (DUF4349)
MTSPDLSPELAALLRSSRPAASPELRGRIRELAAREPASEPFWTKLRLPARRAVLVAVPAAAALAIAGAGALGLARSDGTTEATRDAVATESFDTSAGKAVPEAAPGLQSLTTPRGSSVAPTPGRAQRVSATLTVEVADPEAVSDAARNALELTQSLGGHVVTAAVATGEQGSAAITVRVPVTKVQEAIVGLSGIGRIVSQQVSIQDLQEDLDRLERQERRTLEQIARISARLESDALDPGTRAVLEARRRVLRAELRTLRQGLATTNAEARMATIQLTVVTPEASGVVPVPSRLDRTLDEAVNVLVWEGVVALAVLIVAAPFAIVALAVWFGNRFYRRREDERLLTAN